MSKPFDKPIPVYKEIGGGWHEVKMSRENPFVHLKAGYGWRANDEVVAWLDEHAPGAYRFKQIGHTWGDGVPWVIGVRFKDFNIALLFRMRFS